MAAISVEDLKSLAQHIHGQPKSIARLVDEFHEKYSQYLKRNIEAQIKQMTKYEKRGADTRLNYYLTKELQEKYGIKVWLIYIYIKGVRMRAMRATNQLTTFVGNATTIGSREATGPPNPASTEIYLWD